MARIEFPVWTVARAALMMPFRFPLALVKFGLLPLLIATVCLPPALNIGHTTSTTVDGSPAGSVGEMFSTTDNEIGLRDLVGFVLMLPFAAAFAAAWTRLTATGDIAAMGRPPIAFDTRTVGVIWSFIR
jgi:preprotein translocase subunit SecY